MKKKSSLNSFFKGVLLFIVVLIGGSILIFKAFDKDLKEEPEKEAKKIERVPAQKPEPLKIFLKEIPPSKPAPKAQKKVLEKRKVKPSCRIAIVIDDLGYNIKQAQDLARISPKITIAILPFLSDSKKIADFSNKNQQEILLHLPMEPMNSEKIAKPQTGMLFVKMSPNEISERVEKELKEFPAAVGVNNHMGSLFTSDRAAMLPFLRQLGRHSLFFLDSYTSDKSIGEDLAGELHMPALRRDVFLDNKEDKIYILNQLRELVKLAKKRGQAIGIGHPHKETFEALRDFVPLLENEGVELIKLSALIKNSTVKNN